MLAGWISRHQQEIIEYLKTENAILRNKIGKKRIILTGEQKRLLAASGKKLGRKVLSEICCAFSPDTILKWHRKLIAAKYEVNLSQKPTRLNTPYTSVTGNSRVRRNKKASHK
jgi:hypothetical protein